MQFNSVFLEIIGVHCKSVESVFWIIFIKEMQCIVVIARVSIARVVQFGARKS